MGNSTLCVMPRELPAGARQCKSTGEVSARSIRLKGFACVSADGSAPLAAQRRFAKPGFCKCRQSGRICGNKSGTAGKALSLKH